MVGTYNSKYDDGSKSYGGYSDYCRVPSHFVLKIPDAIASEDAAPMLCGGITLYSPLKKNGCGPGKKVGIVGVGGLGHFGILYAKALGADKVTAISRSAAKKSDTMKMGADEFFATNDDSDWATHHARSLDLSSAPYLHLICLSSSISCFYAQTGNSLSRGPGRQATGNECVYFDCERMQGRRECYWSAT